MKLMGWHLIDEPGAEPLATERDTAWAWVEQTTQGTHLIVHHCSEAQRAHVPVEVVDALLEAWRRRKKP